MPNCRYNTHILILLLYFTVQTICFEEAGIVGEVAIGWSSKPNVIINTHPTTLDTGHEWGLFLARQTRPMESIGVFGYNIPLAINSYTSALPDWPSSILYSLVSSPQLIQIFHIILGGGVIALCMFLFRGKRGLIMAALLACDWTFLIYKQLLGGTEICLQIAVIGLLWSIYEKKSWAHAIFFGFLGLQAKLTFACIIIPILFAILLFRHSLESTHTQKGILFGGLLLVPLLITNAHHLQTETIIQSHDTMSTQWQRIIHVFSDQSQQAIREQNQNIWLWIGNPLSFYERIYMISDRDSWYGYIRILGWILLCGVWIRRFSVQDKSISFVFVVSLLTIGLGPKDLHHFALLTPIWAYWVAGIFQHRENAFIWLTPFMISGVIMCWQSDTVFAQISVPSFAKTKQKHLFSLLEKHQVQRLVTMDYELYGLFETQQPQRELYHGWGAISHRRYHTIPHLIEQAKNGHILLVSASMPMRYNLNPTTKQIEEAAAKRKLRTHIIEETPEYRLFQVLPQE